MNLARKALPVSKRDGYWYLIRRVPVRYEAVDRRVVERMSTGVRIGDDPKAIVASGVAAELNAKLEQRWRALIEGRDPDAPVQAENAVRITRRYGFDYVEFEQLLAGSVSKIIARTLAVGRDARGAEFRLKETAPAVFGFEKPPRPEVPVSKLLSTVEEIAALSLQEKSPDQMLRRSG